MPIVSVYNPKTRQSSELEIGSKGLMFRRAVPEDRRDLDKTIEQLNLQGAPWRKESFGKNNNISIGFEFVAPSDKRFPSAVVSFFRSSGNAARVFDDPKRAELWRLLYVVRVENDIRAGLLANLDAMTQEEVDDLLDQFSKTAAALTPVTL